MEQAYDSKSGWEWKQDRRTWDRLEALTLMCFNANRSRRFMLTRYLKEFAMYFGCHPLYYADPYTSCQRAKNENNHLLVRRMSPKRHRLVHRSVKSSLASA